MALTLVSHITRNHFDSIRTCAVVAAVAAAGCVLHLSTENAQNGIHTDNTWDEIGFQCRWKSGKVSVEMINCIHFKRNAHAVDETNKFPGPIKCLTGFSMINQKF